jgi:hypothetical protein
VHVARVGPRPVYDRRVDELVHGLALRLRCRLRAVAIAVGLVLGAAIVVLAVQALAGLG